MIKMQPILTYLQGFHYENREDIHVLRHKQLSEARHGTVEGAHNSHIPHLEQTYAARPM